MRGKDRICGAIEAIRDGIAAVSGLSKPMILEDDDLVCDLSLDDLELEGLSLILEEIFAIEIPESLWKSPLYRTPSSLADWLIMHSDAAAWAESQAVRKRA